jgi:hypothetical protein
MAASVVVKTKTNVGAKKRVLAEVTLDSSYTTGGYEIKPSQLAGLRVIDDAQCGFKALSGAEATAVGAAFYNPATKKLTIQSYKTQTEIAAATSLSSVVVILEAWGR